MLNPTVPPRDLTSAETRLLERALEVAPRALNPVSRFHVGAAIQAADGDIYTGTFFESSSFPLGVCAEAAALAAALTAGVRDFDTIAVVGGDPRSPEPGRPVTPCGGCRQRIFDVTGAPHRNVNVLCADLTVSQVYRLGICDLLPLPFSVEDLPPSSA
ncbi:cytidine deaminase [Streptomyces sp. NPDC051218]|uniref:cytidine deaminase n=1 Tax=Streptomyces sp. NPDC051218 TaxID=3365645 RepID=UPI0037BA0964